MKQYRIDIINCSGVTDYTLDTNGTYRGDGETSIELEDFLSIEDVTIQKVTRTTDNISFIVGDILTISNDEQEEIETIYTDKGICKLSCSEGSVIELRNATKYTPRSRNTRTTNTTNNAFDEIKQSIERSNPREVRILGVLKRRTESLQEFLVRFFTEFNLDKDTIYLDDRSVQTEAGKRRSLGDIYMICKYYFPNVTLKELIQLLYVDLFNEIDGFRSSYCNTIHKRVWYYSEGNDTEMLNKTQNDEFGKPHRFYIDNLN